MMTTATIAVTALRAFKVESNMSWKLKFERWAMSTNTFIQLMPT